MAYGLAGLLSGAGGVWLTVAEFVAFGVLRVLLNYRAEGLLSAAATRVVSDARAGSVGREARAWTAWLRAGLRHWRGKSWT